MNSWYEFDCPNCKAKCFIDNGNPYDFTQGDPDGFECWNCHSNYEVKPDGELCQVGENEFVEADINPVFPFSNKKEIDHLIKLLNDPPKWVNDPHKWANGKLRWLIQKITGLHIQPKLLD